jgi:hypothetical protein
MDDLFGRDLFGNPIKPKASGPVAERFTFPPFSVLDARSGDWQDRKRAWKTIGINGDDGRVCIGNSAWNSRSLSEQKGAVNLKIASVGDGPTMFDPVLCELAYRWWSPPDGQVIDPFAGGSVRGIIAGSVGRRYWGCDLRPEQVAANEEQATTIGTTPRPEWVCGDSRSMLAASPTADFVFSCPPYGDLEVYSDRPEDLSAMEWPAFLAAYREIITASVQRLKPNRFACFVVGDFRDGKGLYRNFVGETVAAFETAGAHFYNDAVLLNSIGSAPLRMSKIFASGRKLCKVHQNVLVFVKGDPKKATAACGELT